jgi:hypothetical protein
MHADSNSFPTLSEAEQAALFAASKMMFQPAKAASSPHRDPRNDVRDQTGSSLLLTNR